MPPGEMDPDTLLLDFLPTLGMMAISLFLGSVLGPISVLHLPLRFAKCANEADLRS